LYSFIDIRADREVAGVEKVIKGYAYVAKGFAVMSGISVCVMMTVTVADIFMRAVMNSSITGGTEIVAMVMVCVVYFGVGYTAFKRGMITVDIIKVPFYVVLSMNVLSFITGVVLIIALLQQAGVALARGGGTLRLHIPNWPFMYITAFGFMTVLLSLVVLIIADFKNKKLGIGIGGYTDDAAAGAAENSGEAPVSAEFASASPHRGESESDD
jgi:TRAP-type C4-dicarboxylate transport system permease small subunit